MQVEKLATVIMNNPNRPLELRATEGSSAVSRSPTASFSVIPEITTFFHNYKNSFLLKIV